MLECRLKDSIKATQSIENEFELQKIRKQGTINVCNVKIVSFSFSKIENGSICFIRSATDIP